MIDRVRQCPKHDLTYSGKECPECSRLRARAWRARNSEFIKQQNRERYQLQREWKRNHPDRAKEHQRRYYERKGSTPQRAYEARNRSEQSERRKRWKRANPLKVREYARRRDARKSASSQKVDYGVILARYGWRCHLCGRYITSKRDLHFDHVIPLSRGGTHTEDNIRPAHAHCNLKKNNRMGEAFMSVTIVRYERLWNLGNYENLKLCAEAIVEAGHVDGAWAEAKAAVEAHYATFIAEREEAERRRREEWEAERKQRIAEQEAERERRRQETPTKAEEEEEDDDDLYESGDDVFPGNPDDE